MRHIAKISIFIITMLALVGIANGQTVMYTGDTIQATIQRGGYGAELMMLIPQDTNINLFPRARKNGRIASKNGVLYAYDTIQHKWVAPTGGTGSTYYPGYGVIIRNDSLIVDTTQIATANYVYRAVRDTANNLRGWVNGLFTGYYTSSQVDAIIANYYTKTQVDNLLNGKQNNADSGSSGANKYTTPTIVDTKINTAISGETLQTVAGRGDSTDQRLVAGDSTNQGILSIFGDSFTLGGGATTVTLPYTTLLGQYLHLTPHIHAHGGATAHHGTPHNSNGDLIDSLSAIEIKPTTNSKLMFVFTFNDACGQVANADYTATNAIADISTAIDTALNRGWSTDDIELCTLWCMDTTQITTVCGASMTMQRFRNFVDTVKYLGVQRSIRVTDLFTAFYTRYYKSLLGTDNYHPKDEGHRESAGDMLATWGYKVISNGGTLFGAPLYSSNGIQELTLNTDGNVRIENKLSINTNPLSNTYLNVPSTNKMVAAELAYIDFQAISLNNVFFGNNVYYNSGYKHRYTGYSQLATFQSRSFVLLMDQNTGSADGNMTVSCPFAVIANGSAGIGGVLSRVTDIDISGASIKVFPTTYNVSIGTAVSVDPGYKFYIGGTMGVNNYIVHENLNTYSTGGKTYYVINSSTKRGETVSSIPQSDIANLAGDSVYVRNDSLFQKKNGVEFFRYLHSAGGGGGVSNVTATAPITSSGGSTPNVTIDTTTASGGWHSYNYYKTVFANITHTHAESDITNLVTDLAGKQAALGFTPENTANKATSFSTINNTLFPTVQACSTYVANAIAALSSVYAPITHTHAWTDITSTPTTIAGYGITDYNSLWDTRFATKHRIDSANYADTAKYAVNAGTSQNNYLNNINIDNTTNATEYIPWVQSNSGFMPLYVSSSKLTFNPSTGNLSSTLFSGALSGNASTATTLQTARNINGVSFNGSADITVTAAAGTLTGSSLNSTVTGSSLTSVGTLTGLTMGGNIAMGTNSITMTGAIGATGARVTKGWFTDGEFTNVPTVGGVALPTASSTTTFTNKTLTSSTNTLGGVTMGLGSDATGDIYYRNSGGVLTRLPIGSSSQVLTVSGGLPTWAAASGGGGTNPVIYVQTADASVTNSTTETNMLGTGNGSATLSAGVSNHIGDQIEIYASGQFILPSSASGNSVWKLYYGSTALATSPTMDVSSATGAFVAGTGNWEFKGAIVTRTTGATGTVMVTGVLTITGTGSGNPSFPYAYAVKMDNVTATTVDLTATQAITLTQKFSTAQTGKTANGKNCIIKYHGTP